MLRKYSKLFLVSSILVAFLSSSALLACERDKHHASKKGVKEKVKVAGGGNGAGVKEKEKVAAGGGGWSREKKKLEGADPSVRAKDTVLTGGGDAPDDDAR